MLKNKIRNLLSKRHRVRESTRILEKHDENTPEFTLKGNIHLAKVVRVYDGDTCYCVFKVDDKYQQFRIRMLGYDSPEMRPPTSLTDDEREQIKQKALESKAKLEELVLNKLVYVYCGDFDNFGRVIAEIKVDKQDSETVNQIMINEGYGEVYIP